jgi:hypothetical protein
MVMLIRIAAMGHPIITGTATTTAPGMVALMGATGMAEVATVVGAATNCVAWQASNSTNPDFY